MVRALLGLARHEAAVSGTAPPTTRPATVMAYLLGRPVGPVSIRPCEVHLDVSFHTKARVPQEQMGTLGRPAILLPAQLRRTCEAEAVIALAGPTAEDVAVTATEGATYVDEHTPDHVRAEELVTTLVEAGSRTRRRSCWSGRSKSGPIRRGLGMLVLRDLQFRGPHYRNIGALGVAPGLHPECCSARFQRLEYAFAPRLLEAEVLGEGPSGRS